ncbi:WD40 repeat-like protein [Polychaeton citri CBS 116435]|uniref:WD40 repeat-like protein n=1 Tax=Polychaeton citri CBS 116435 TaxID=1314669 RepID=A0A9P4UK68_9PEZI|nr:WD40 repeat-like protein [Polychaeton citri CBS 116435]
MPFGHSHHHSQHQQQHDPATGIYRAAGALGSIAAPNLQRLASATTSAGTDSLTFAQQSQAQEPHAGFATGQPGLNVPQDPMTGRLGGAGTFEGSGPPLSAPATVVSSDPQPFGTPRRQHSQRISEDKPSLSSSANPPFNPQQATPRTAHFPPAAIVPSNARPGPVPGSLQPAGGSQRPAPASANTAPTAVPTLQSQPIQTNMQHYTQQQQQTPSRSGTLHSHSRSSPAGMDSAMGSKYIPFSQTPTQTPISSNPKAFNAALSPQTPNLGQSHSPLNLTDIRAHTLESQHDGGMGTNMIFKYSDTPTNSNYLAPFSTYAYDWCKWPVVNNNGGAGKMALGSYLEDPHNFIQILDTHISHQENAGIDQPQYGIEYTKVAEATCAYPVTRILWEPPSSQKQSTDLLATSGDHLRLWSLPQSSAAQTQSNNINRSASANTRDQALQKLQPLALLSNSKTPEHTAPLTSLDWNTLSPKLIITSSIDTTCTIWDIPTLTAKTQLIAHDKEVFDVRFCAGSVDVFVSCGADGSVRMFDLRSLEHSTIIYEPAEKGEQKGASPSASSPTKASQGHSLTPSPPLLRLAASPHDAHLLATFASDSNIIRILDVRQPGTALLELRGHQGNLNTIEWNPHRRGMLASGADDSTVLVWDLLNSQNQAQLAANGGASGSAPAQSDVQAKGPSASWKCEYEVGNVSWAPQSALTGQGGDWLGVCAGRGVWGVKL